MDKDYYKQYHARNRERRNALAKQRRKSNPVLYKEQQKQSRLKNLEKRREDNRKWYKNNKTSILTNAKTRDAARIRNARYKRKYGITIEQYEAMLQRQYGRCAICERLPKTRRLAVEHDHKTKRVRGLACSYCNHYLIAKNTAETARKVADYLESTFDGRKIEEEATPAVRRKRTTLHKVRKDFLPAEVS